MWSQPPRPSTVSVALGWRLFARCDSYDTDIFFAPEKEAPAERARREFLAKRICRRCPVLMTCRIDALRRGEMYGVWGGLSERDRVSLLQFG